MEVGMITRRRFLVGTGLAGAVAALGGPAAQAVQGDVLIPGADDRRRRLLRAYLGDDSREILVRPLQESLELWELSPAGYFVVDSASLAVLEYATSTPSPFADVLEGDLYYLGIGGFIAERGTGAVNVLTEERFNSAGLSSMGVDSFDELHAIAEVDVSILNSMNSSSVGRADGGVSVMSAPQSVKAADVKKRVTSYAYARNRHVYANVGGMCGRIAGSIITRYWHARSTARKLLPAKFRNGTDLHKTQNFAKHLQSTRANDTWGKSLVDPLLLNASAQGVSVECFYNLLATGVKDGINNNRPAILFGRYPKINGDGKSNHAVVAYGLTTSDDFIVHYGYTGKNNIVLNKGISVSNTKFWLK